MPNNLDSARRAIDYGAAGTPPLGVEIVDPGSQKPIQEDLMMLPLDAVIEYPSSDETALDTSGEAEVSNGLRYHIKGDQKGRTVCASEWLCTKIAEETGIASPQSALIRRLDGSLVFGSQRISGVADKIVTLTFLTTPSQLSDLQTPPTLRRILSEIYAYDLFINNLDRHLGNYLSADVSGYRRLYAMDYSRALFFQWPFDGFPPPDQKTRFCGKILRQHHGFDEGAALNMIDKLGRLSIAN